MIFKLKACDYKNIPLRVRVKFAKHHFDKVKIL